MKRPKIAYEFEDFKTEMMKRGIYISARRLALLAGITPRSLHRVLAVDGADMSSTYADRLRDAMAMLRGSQQDGQQ